MEELEPIVEHEVNSDDQLNVSTFIPNSDYDGQKSNLFGTICHRDQNVDWRNILESCGKSINHIYDGGYCMTAEIFSLARKFCPQLKTINISVTHGNLQYVKLYLPQWKTLEEIELRGPASIADILWSLREMPHLRKLSLWDFDITISECMALNCLTQLEHFEISYMECGFPAKISGLLRKLISIHIYTMCAKTTRMELSQYCTKLEYLYLFDAKERVTWSIDYFPNLKFLEVHDQYASAYFLLNTLDTRYNNQLQKLIIPGKYIYQQEAQRIAKLRALRTLSCVLPDVRCLKYLVQLQLEHLSLYNCSKLSNTLLLLILRDFKTLRSLEITLCSMITSHFVKDALKILHQNGVKPENPLELKIIGSALGKDIQDKLPTLLHSNLLNLVLY